MWAGDEGEMGGGGRAGHALEALRRLPEAQRSLLVGAARLAAGEPPPSTLHSEALPQLASTVSDDGTRRSRPAPPPSRQPLGPCLCSLLRSTFTGQSRSRVGFLQLSPCAIGTGRARPAAEGDANVGGWEE